MKNILKKTFIVIVILIIACFAFYKLSPYPSVWIIRYAFNKEAEKTNRKLKKFVPQHIHAIQNIQYDIKDHDAFLDVYYPSSIQHDGIPMIVWTHGGGLISGNKNHLSNYCKILASYGYSVVSIDYTVAPKGKYPKPIEQLNKALEYISLNADLFKGDISKIILAGDSGGSMIAATTANIITNPSYAELVKVKQELNPIS